MFHYKLKEGSREELLGYIKDRDLHNKIMINDTIKYKDILKIKENLEKTNKNLFIYDYFGEVGFIKQNESKPVKRS